MFTPYRLQEINSGIARFATPGKGDFLLGLYYYFIPPIRLHDALCIPPLPPILTVNQLSIFCSSPLILCW